MKKQTLLKTMMLGLLALSGMSSAWGKVVHPTKLIQYRANNAIADATDWHSTDFPKDASNETNLEVTGTTYMWAILEYQIPDIANVSSISMPFEYSNSNKDVNIFLWNNSYPDAKANWDDTFKTNIQTEIAKSAFATITSSNKTIDISGDKLTTLKTTFGSTGTVTVKFLLYIKNSSDAIKLHGGGASYPRRKPHLEIAYTGDGDAIKIGDTPYTTLAAAVTAASDKATITIYNDIYEDDNLNITKNITFKSAANKDVVIYRLDDGDNPLFKSTTTGSTVTVTFDGTASNSSLTIDNGNCTRDKAVYANEVGTYTVEFNKVAFRNGASAQKKYLYSKNSGKISLNNVTFTNCKNGEAVIYTTASNTLTLNGTIAFDNCEANIALENNNVTFTDNSSAHAKPYTIYFNKRTSSGNFVASGTASNYRAFNPGYTISQNGSAVQINIAPTTSYTLTIGPAGMATLVLPFNVASLPTGASSGTIQAYKLTTSSSVVSASKVNSITKDEPVLIVGTADTYTFTGDATADYTADAPQSGALIGTYKAIDAADGNYVLQKHAGEDAGFYKLVAASNHVINPFRAYLSSAENAAARLTIVFEDESTGIEAIADSQESKANNQYFDLSGRRVAQPTKGLYIVNGKKVIIK